MRNQKNHNLKSFLEGSSDLWCATIGNFDGVHLGHQYLIENLLEKSKAMGTKSLVITFNPHPHEIFSKSSLTLINDYDKRYELLKSTGVDAIVEIDFNRDFSTLSPSEFLLGHILHQNKIQSLIIGHDFQFGKNKSGDFEFLTRIVKDHNLKVSIERTKVFIKDGDVLSSSFIRELIGSGQVEKANRCLGHTYSLKGLVVKGDGRGKEIGFPTANILFPELSLRPLNGVYKTFLIHDGKQYQSITNVGVKPTVSDANMVNVETHILNFDQDIYGEEIDVHFESFIREEKKFETLEQLVDQISLDVSSIGK